MIEEDLHNQRTVIRDRLAYLVVYAVDFPVEDCTSLKKERDALFAELVRYEHEFPVAIEHPRYALFKTELGCAFEAAASGVPNITQLFQIAAGRFDETLRPLASGPDFIASPSGTIKV